MKGWEQLGLSRATPKISAPITFRRRIMDAEPRVQIRKSMSPAVYKEREKVRKKLAMRAVRFEKLKKILEESK